MHFMMRVISFGQGAAVADAVVLIVRLVLVASTVVVAVVGGGGEEGWRPRTTTLQRESKLFLCFMGAPLHLSMCETCAAELISTPIPFPYVHLCKVLLSGPQYSWVYYTILYKTILYYNVLLY